MCPGCESLTFIIYTVCILSSDKNAPTKIYRQRETETDRQTDRQTDRHRTQMVHNNNHNNILIAVISIAPYLTDKDEHTAFYRIKKNVYIKT